MVEQGSVPLLGASVKSQRLRAYLQSDPKRVVPFEKNP